MVRDMVFQEDILHNDENLRNDMPIGTYYFHNMTGSSEEFSLGPRLNRWNSINDSQNLRA